MRQVNGMMFRDAGEFYDWYTQNQIYFGLVVDDLYFGDGEIFKGSPLNSTRLKCSREDFVEKATPELLQALGLIATVFLMGFNHAMLLMIHRDLPSEGGSDQQIPVLKNGTNLN